MQAAGHLPTWWNHVGVAPRLGHARPGFTPSHPHTHTYIHIYIKNLFIMKQRHFGALFHYRVTKPYLYVYKYDIFCLLSFLSFDSQSKPPPFPLATAHGHHTLWWLQLCVTQESMTRWRVFKFYDWRHDHVPTNLWRSVHRSVWPMIAAVAHGSVVWFVQLGFLFEFLIISDL